MLISIFVGQISALAGFGRSGTQARAYHMPKRGPCAPGHFTRASSLYETFDQSTDDLLVHIKLDGAPVHLRLEPQLPLGAGIISGLVRGRQSTVHVEAHGEDEHAVLNPVVPQVTCEVSISYRGGIAIIMPPLVGDAQSEELRLKVVHPDAAGIDMGNESQYVAVPPTRDNQPIRCFGSHSRAEGAGSSLTCDIGVGGSDDEVDARSRDMQCVDRRRSGIPPRRTRLLVDDNADAAWHRNGEVRVGGEDWLTGDDQPDQLGAPAGGGLSVAAGGARVRLHQIGSNQATQQIQAVDG